MTYRNILVHLNPGSANDRILNLTAGLAAGLGARVIGCAASRPFPATYTENLAAVTAEIVAEVQENAGRDMQRCEDEFRAAMQGRVKELEWRSTLSADSLSDYFAKEARTADLLITSAGGMHLNPAELAISAGRPVLIIPPGLSRLDVRRAVIAWKDSREARRAVVDALPLLKLAQRCSIIEITSLDMVGDCRRRLEDVAGWLATHGVASDVLPVGANGAHSLFLVDELRRLVPDLVVAGAYGHSRLSEWVFGGVTRDVLLRPESCVLISH